MRKEMRSKEHKQNLSAALKGRTLSEEHKRKLSETATGRRHSEAVIQKISESQKVRMTPEIRAEIGNRSRRQIRSDESREKMRVSRLGQEASDETKQKMREKRTQAWQRDEYVRAQMVARQVVPNQLELATADWLNPLGFQFVGDGQLIIAGKCPDFWDGNKKLIEIYGDYWHAGQDPHDRIDLFKAEGYDCIVIWESELNTELRRTQTRVEKFITG